MKSLLHFNFYGMTHAVAIFRASLLVVNERLFVFCSFAGAEIDCEDKNGNSPLHIAARYGHELLINTLITNGADTAK